MTQELSLSEVSKIYGKSPEVHALADINLTIGQGEFIAIEGESGGGKSTLLNIIGLLDTPTSGVYRIDGKAVAGTSTARLPLTRSDSFAYIFQAFHILERRPVVDSVELPMLYRGLPPGARRQRALDALEQVGIGNLAYAMGRNLSGGQRQRVAVARALASQAPVLLADEPTGNLDSQNTEAVMECLRRVHETGTTVILVTHSADLAARASRRIRISDGAVLADTGKTEHVVSAQAAPGGKAGRVRVLDALSDAFSNIRSRLGRTTGLIAAVAVSIALAIATMGLAYSAEAQVSDAFNAAESVDVFVQWDALNEDTGTAESVVERLKNLNGVTTASVVSHHDSHAIRVSAVRAPLMAPVSTLTGDVQSARLTVEWGRLPVKDLAPASALIGRNLADQLELAPLATMPVIEVGGLPLSIAGIIDSSPRMPEWLGGIVVGPGDEGFTERTITVTALATTATGAARQVSREAPMAINPITPEGLIVQTPVDPNSLRAIIEGNVSAALIVLTAVAFVGSVASVTLATLTAVAERRGEIGLRRALGARRRDIWTMLTLESMAVGLAGGAIGVYLGLAAVLAVTIIRQWTPVFDARLAMAAIAAGAVIGIIGAVAGAARALRINPSDALRPGN